MSLPLPACDTWTMPVNLTDGPAGGDPSAERSEVAPPIAAGPVRPEEMVLVASALVIWVAAILLCVHRWGKIRMLEPYLPDYNDPTSQKGGLLMDASPALAFSRLHSPLIPMVHCPHGRGSMACQHSQSTSRLLSHARDACALAAARKTRSADSLVTHTIHVHPPNSLL
ncbi:uncharacterized protein LOC122364225 isoform X2 [Amphibalanus amphitrite]|nr:uncharacterized protein LOC122364225 isoform X2 [Amphibalanus amphitrite]